MNTSFFKIAEILSNSDWSSLRKFLSMSNGETTDLMKLFAIYESHKHKLSDLIDDPDIITQQFKHLTRKGLLNLHSRLFVQTEDWLAHKTLMEDQDKKELLLNKAYNDIGLYKFANQKSLKLQKRWKANSALSTRKEQFRTQLLHQQYYSDNPTKYDKDSSLLADLANAYLSAQKHQGLLYLLELRNWGNIKNLDFTKQIEVLSTVIKVMPEQEISILLSELLKVVTSDSLESFMSVKEKLLGDRLEKESEFHQLVTLYLVSFSLKYWQKGVLKDADIIAQVLEYALSNNVLMKSGKIPKVRFYNLIATLGTMNTYDWNDAFIERWQSSVETESPDSTKALSKALNAFIFHKYELIIPLLRGVEFESYSEKIRALGIELVALYVDRKANYHLIRTFINNFKRTLRRNSDKTSNYFVKAHINLVAVIEDLIQRDFRRITINLDKYDNLLYRIWLQNEVNKKAPKT